MINLYQIVPRENVFPMQNILYLDERRKKSQIILWFLFLFFLFVFFSMQATSDAQKSRIYTTRIKSDLNRIQMEIKNSYAI